MLIMAIAFLEINIVIYMKNKLIVPHARKNINCERQSEQKGDILLMSYNVLYYTKHNRETVQN